MSLRVATKAVAIELLEPAFCDGKPASYGAEAGFLCGFRTDQPSGLSASLSPPVRSVRRSFRPAYVPAHDVQKTAKNDEK